jgi:hypothetical protein
LVLRKIISAGQTGADRAGLDFAIEVGLEHGGFVARGRRAEEGRMPGQFTLPSLRVFYMPCGLSGMFEKPTGQ